MPSGGRAAEVPRSRGAACVRRLPFGTALAGRAGDPELPVFAEPAAEGLGGRTPQRSVPVESQHADLSLGLGRETDGHRSESSSTGPPARSGSLRQVRRQAELRV